MDKQELKKLIERGESRNLEFKESLSLKDEIGENVSAFSNSCNGVILIGVSDLREVKGVQIGRKTIEELANYIKQHTDNSIYPSIGVERIGDKEIIVMEINESGEKPVFFKRRAYIRVGKSVHKLSASEIRKLAKESVKSYWDGQVCEGAGLDDIDYDFVKWFIKEYGKISKLKILSNLKNLLKVLGCLKGGRLTNAGVLLFSKDPQKFFPNAVISIARYKGKTVGTEKFDYHEFSGNLFLQIDKADEYVKSHIAIMSRLHPYQVQREDIPEYPFFALRELIVNAVCHRDYFEQGSKVIIKMFDDRIDYYNPGGLPGKITPKNIVNMQKSRNPVIVKTLNKLRYIEELGEGWDRIIEEYKTHPLRPKEPEIKDFKDAVLVTIHKATLDLLERFREELNERQIKLIEYLKTHEFIRSETYSKMFNITDRQARSDLSKLVSLELLLKEGKARLIKYKLNPEISGNIRK